MAAEAISFTWIDKLISRVWLRVARHDFSAATSDNYDRVYILKHCSNSCRSLSTKKRSILQEKSRLFIGQFEKYVKTFFLKSYSTEFLKQIKTNWIPIDEQFLTIFFHSSCALPEQRGTLVFFQGSVNFVKFFDCIQNSLFKVYYFLIFWSLNVFSRILKISEKLLFQFFLDFSDSETSGRK